MIKIVVVLSLLILCFQPREAATSQVTYMDSGDSLESVVQLASDIVIVRKRDQFEVYLEKPIEVPGKEEPFIYNEMVDLYEVVTVVKSDTIKPAQIIKIWTAPAYNYEMTKAYYVDGESESPIIQQYKPVHVPKDGENVILMLNGKEPDKAVYSWRATEGLMTLPQIKTILKKPAADMPVMPE